MLEKKIISQEANAIGTAYLRLDLLSEPIRSEVKAKFIEYVEARVELFSRLSNQENAKQIDRKESQLQSEIWSTVISTRLSSENGYIYILLLPALNEMFDITTVRKNAIQTHTPIIIFGVLVGIALVLYVLGWDENARVDRSSLVICCYFFLYYELYIISDS